MWRADAIGVADPKHRDVKGISATHGGGFSSIEALQVLTARDVFGKRLVLTYDCEVGVDYGLG